MPISRNLSASSKKGKSCGKEGGPDGRPAGRLDHDRVPPSPTPIRQRNRSSPSARRLCGAVGIEFTNPTCVESGWLTLSSPRKKPGVKPGISLLKANRFWISEAEVDGRLQSVESEILVDREWRSGTKADNFLATEVDIAVLRAE